MQTLGIRPALIACKETIQFGEKISDMGIYVQESTVASSI